MKIATLGPEGTFSQQAVNKAFPKAPILFCKTIKDVFITVDEGRADKGVVPIENSLGGGVSFTLDALQEYDLKIEAEEIVPIIHCLMAPKIVKPTEIKTLYLHPQTYAQCEEFIHRHLPNATVVETLSNADSAERVKNNGGTSACIAPEIAAEIYGLKILKKSVQDNQFNVTRFFVLSAEDGKVTGNTKTSLTVYPQVDRPGLLYEILGIFKEENINLTKIESRPSKGRLGDYIFYLDIAGSYYDEPVKMAILKLEKISFVKVLGSYERKY